MQLQLQTVREFSARGVKNQDCSKRRVRDWLDRAVMHRGRLGIEDFNMARNTNRIRLHDRDVFPAVTEGPANVFSSTPFLLVKAR